jgi:hypothetical protein
VRDGREGKLTPRGNAARDPTAVAEAGGGAAGLQQQKQQNRVEVGTRKRMRARKGGQLKLPTLQFEARLL